MLESTPIDQQLQRFRLGLSLLRFPKEGSILRRRHSNPSLLEQEMDCQSKLLWLEEIAF